MKSLLLDENMPLRFRHAFGWHNGLKLGVGGARPVSSRVP